MPVSEELYEKTSEVAFFHNDVDYISDNAYYEKDQLGSVSDVLINGICTYIELK